MTEDKKKTRIVTETTQKTVIEVQEILRYDLNENDRITKTPLTKFNELAERVNIIDWRPIILIPSSLRDIDIAAGSGIWVKYEMTQSKIVKLVEASSDE